MNLKNDFLIIGLMSGSSLDGLDIAACNFIKNDSRWTFSIIETKCISYSKEQKNKLEKLSSVSAKKLVKAHADYGIWTGNCVQVFINKYGLKPDFISSHGHTIFHEPAEAYSFQLGSPAHISSASGIDCIGDFRNSDMALGGEGAPLAPIADLDLFPEYEVCINLGGIANISYMNKSGQLVGFDVSVCNLIFNHLSEKFGKDFDEDGVLGLKGTLNEDLLLKLENLDFYKKRAARSLDREWFSKNVEPLFSDTAMSIEDQLHTAYIHVSEKIAHHINLAGGGKKVLLSGGGTKNKYLVRLIQEATASKIFVPDESVIDFKECVLMAYLGLLRVLKTNNCISSVTGAERSCSGGGVYLN
ncbi:MAG TPA: anhydro-N-acetylmuramic acid kinase [Bacteroidetes bacterium]|nr:anhydro-N-acetylmuramic acid kinase [Bacteroidota bacterium]